MTGYRPGTGSFIKAPQVSESAEIQTAARSLGIGWGALLLLVPFSNSTITPYSSQRLSCQSSRWPPIGGRKRSQIRRSAVGFTWSGCSRLSCWRFRLEDSVVLHRCYPANVAEEGKKHPRG